MLSKTVYSLWAVIIMDFVCPFIDRLMSLQHPVALFKFHKNIMILFLGLKLCTACPVTFTVHIKLTKQLTWTCFTSHVFNHHLWKCQTTESLVTGCQHLVLKQLADFHHGFIVGSFRDKTKKFIACCAIILHRCVYGVAAKVKCTVTKWDLTRGLPDGWWMNFS